MALLLLALQSFAWAESAQTTSPKTISLYSGLSFGQWNSFDDSGESKEPFGSDSMSLMGWYSQYETGITNKVDLKVGIPVTYAFRADGPESDLFAPTLAIAYPSLSSRISLFREGGAMPVSLAANIAYKTGVFHTSTTSRLTNAGEGTNDVGLGLILSRFLSRDGKYLSIESDLRYWFRSPIDDDLDPVYPYDDITYSASIYGSFNPKYALGVFLEGYSRTGGLDYSERMEASSAQQWSALNGAQAKAGVKGSYIISPTMGLHSFVGYSILARNNPDNEWVSGLGISYYRSPS